MRYFPGLIAITAVTLAPSGLPAGEAKVIGATYSAGRIDVTVQHGDTGWDHYADGWRVFASDGTLLGYRELLHPHVSEQPFTRSLSGITIPPGETALTIIAHDSVHGDGPAFTLPLK